MSMPTFPDKCTVITRDQAFNMILGSIAMEETALSNIMCAEGNVLRHFSSDPCNNPCDCCRNHSGSCSCKSSWDFLCTNESGELVELNRSISDVMEHVMHNQIILKQKMCCVLKAMEQEQPNHSCHPPCDETHSEHCCDTFYIPGNTKLYCGNYAPLICSKPCRAETGGRPATVQAAPLCLNQACRYRIELNLQIRCLSPCSVTVCLKTMFRKQCLSLMTVSLPAPRTGNLLQLTGSTTLDPETFHGISQIPVMLTLLEPKAILIEQGVLCFSPL